MWTGHTTAKTTTRSCWRRCGCWGLGRNEDTPQQSPGANVSERSATISRRTGETDITLTLAIDGSGTADLATGIGFLDHMLTLFAKHGLFDISAKAIGDLHVDEHHTAE